ncbi:MAG: hypothetical protein M5U26_00590 [Planctomycetota bacterium]|nr:hypothetical protein [Planctomycetota bacterium]
MSTPPLTGNVVPRDRANLRWAKALALVLGILIVCYLAGQRLAEKVRDATPEELMTRLGAEEPPALDEVIAQVNRMEVQKRREVMRSPQAQRFFERLAPEQRARFVKETLDRGIQDQIERYRKLAPEERKAFIEEALERQRKFREQMEELPPEERKRMRDLASNANMQETVERAVKEFLRVTSSEERAELAPLYEGALENLKKARSLPAR